MPVSTMIDCLHFIFSWPFVYIHTYMMKYFRPCLYEILSFHHLIRVITPPPSLLCGGDTGGTTDCGHSEDSLCRLSFYLQPTSLAVLSVDLTIISAMHSFKFIYFFKLKKLSTDTSKVVVANSVQLNSIHFVENHNKIMSVFCF